MLLQAPGPVQKFPERRSRLLQLLQVSQIAVRLDRIDKSIRGLRAPRFEGLRRGQLIESVVDLDRLENARVEIEPSLRRLSFRVEAPAPVLVIPARAADVYFADRKSTRPDQPLPVAVLLFSCLPSGGAGSATLPASATFGSSSLK